MNGSPSEESEALHRRRFLMLMTGWSAVGLQGMHVACSPAGKKDAGNKADEPEAAGIKGAEDRAKPIVVQRLRPGIVKRGESLPKDQARVAMSELLGALAPGHDAIAFLKTVFEPGRKIGIKPNCLAGRGLSTRPELVFALVELLEEAGIRPSDVIVFERTERELARAGFPINTSKSGSGSLVMGNDSPGAGFENQPLLHESIGSCFCRILTRRIDALINFGVLKDHDLAGVSIGMKNLYGLIHNPNKYHDSGCAPYVAHVAASPAVRAKLKLTLCDGLIAQYKGGPALKPEYTWQAGALLASCDPVALDAAGTSLIEAARKEAGIETLEASGRYPAWLADARRCGLGEDRLDRITIKTI